MINYFDDDRELVRELEIREKLKDLFSLQEEDFESAQAYNNHLEHLEDYVYRLLHNWKIAEVNSNIRAFRVAFSQQLSERNLKSEHDMQRKSDKLKNDQILKQIEQHEYVMKEKALIEEKEAQQREMLKKLQQNIPFEYLNNFISRSSLENYDKINSSKEKTQDKPEQEKRHTKSINNIEEEKVDQKSISNIAVAKGGAASHIQQASRVFELNEGMPKPIIQKQTQIEQKKENKILTKEEYDEIIAKKKEEDAKKDALAKLGSGYSDDLVQLRSFYEYNLSLHCLPSTKRDGKKKDGRKKTKKIDDIKIKDEEENNAINIKFGE